MRRKFRRIVRRKVRLGRFGVPLWALALTGVVLAAAAGQAVGPVMSGQVTGSASLTTEQAVLLGTDNDSEIEGLDSEDDGALTTNDEGTNFTAAIELSVGDEVYIDLDLANVSDNTADAMLELNVPQGIDIEVTQAISGDNSEYDFGTDGTSGDLGYDTTDGSGDLEDEAQLSKNVWLLEGIRPTDEEGDYGGPLGTTSGDGTQDLRIIVEPKDSLQPGFYTILGRIVQIDG